MYQISRTHLIGYLVEDGITSSVHAKHTFSRTSIMLRFSYLVPRRKQGTKENKTIVLKALRRHVSLFFLLHVD